MKRVRFLGLVCGLVLVSYLGGVQAQEKYPIRPIELVTPFAPGGIDDVAARFYNEELGRILKVPVTVVNRPGGAGIQGTTYVVRAPKDGYTLLNAPTTAMAISPVISTEATYDSLKDLIPIANFVAAPSVFTVRSDSPFQTMKDVIEYARKNPGKLKNCVGGLGTESYFNMAILCAKNNVTITTVPFKSGGEAMPALLGGHVELSSNSISTQGPHIKAGKIRGLAISSKSRHPKFPDIPTTTELGYPYADFVVRVGLYAPAGVPQTVLDALVPAAEQAFKNPELGRRVTDASIMLDYMGSADLRKFIQDMIPVVRTLAQEANMIKK